MRLRALTVLLLSLSASFAVAPAANASVLTAQASGPAATDGRGIAFSQRPGEIRVVTGGSARDVDVASTCGPLPVQVDAIGAGQVLYGCGAGTSVLPQRLDLASGETHPVPGAAAVIAANAGAVAPYGVSFDGIGSVGVSYVSSVYHATTRGALDWRTGAGVTESHDAMQAIDLDRDGLMATICAPLRKAVTGDGGDTAFWPFHYWKPYALVATERLTLRRCGSRHRVVLSRNAQAPRLGARLVTWFETLLDGDAGGYRASAYALACGGRRSWPVAYDARIAPLARSVLISEHLHYGGPWRIRQVSVRGICRHAPARR